MENIPQASGPTRTAIESTTIVSQRRLMEDGYLLAHAEEILKLVKQYSEKVFINHIQKLTEENSTLREELRKDRQQGSSGKGNYNATVNIKAFDLILETQNMHRQWILEALTQSRGNVAKTARILGISRPQLYDKMQILGIVVAQARIARKSKTVNGCG